MLVASDAAPRLSHFLAPRASQVINPGAHHLQWCLQLINHAFCPMPKQQLGLWQPGVINSSRDDASICVRVSAPVRVAPFKRKPPRGPPHDHGEPLLFRLICRPGMPQTRAACTRSGTRISQNAITKQIGPKRWPFNIVAHSCKSTDPGGADTCSSPGIGRNSCTSSCGLRGLRGSR